MNDLLSSSAYGCISVEGADVLDGHDAAHHASVLLLLHKMALPCVATRSDDGGILVQSIRLLVRQQGLLLFSRLVPAVVGMTVLLGARRFHHHLRVSKGGFG
jgi:hypothetical protein